jgi:hypothetical protein
MKKQIILCVLCVLLVAPAFSQVRMNGWGRIVWVPVAETAKKTQSSIVQSSYGAAPDIEFMFAASSAHIGVDLGATILDASDFEQIANAKVWWKPNNYFKLNLGMGRVQTLRGMVGSNPDYAYCWGRLVKSDNGSTFPVCQIYDGDGIFSRINLRGWGSIVEITPIPGLYLFGAVTPSNPGPSSPVENTSWSAKKMFAGGQYCIGYEIPNVGLVRAGYMGGDREGNGAGGAAGS